MPLESASQFRHPLFALARRLAAAPVAWTGLIVVAVVLAYASALRAPFVFDDQGGVIDNPTIRQLWPPWSALQPPLDATGATGRPLVNLSLALNFALGGLDPRGYHAFNVAVHALAALACFGLLRHTLTRPGWRDRWGDAAVPLSGTIALLWALHPLQTESVTCVIQRSEVLGGAFYLLALYGFVRACAAAAPLRWSLLCVLACLCGMASKEFVVSLPLVALLYDRTFVAGSFAAAWRARRGLYLALAATWMVLIGLVAANAARGGSAGFGLGVSAWDYLLTQCQAIGLYLRLAFWPHPLVLDYGNDLVRSLSAVWPQALLLVTLFAGSVRAAVRRHPIGFAGLCFFALLAPSSSFIPLVTQTIAEHRMYLPLVPLLAGVGLGLHRRAPRAVVPVLLAAALAMGIVTTRRNADYRSAETLWSDTVAKRPQNPRAQFSLAKLLATRGEADAAIEHGRVALALRPDDPEARATLAELLSRCGRHTEALAHFEAALRARPSSADLHANHAAALDRAGRSTAAATEYRHALELDPRLAEAQANFADLLLRRGAAAEAIPHLETAIRLKPGLAGAHYKLATALAVLGRWPEARAAFATAQTIDPSDAVALVNWANALAAAGQLDEADRLYASALAFAPPLAAAHLGRGNLLAARERYDEAAVHYRAALRADSAFAPAHTALGNTLLMLSRDAEAVTSYQTALQLEPNNAGTHNNLGLALARQGRLREAIEHFTAAVRLNPDYPEARDNLARAQAQAGPPADPNPPRPQ